MVYVLWKKMIKTSVKKHTDTLSKIVIDGAVLDHLIWSEFPAESLEITSGVT